MPLEPRGRDHPVAQARQPLPRAADGARQPAVALRGGQAAGERQRLGRAEALPALQHRGQLRLAAALDLLLDARLVAQAARLIEHAALQRVGEILLRDPVVAVRVRVEIALAVAEALLVAARIAQMRGDLRLALLLDRGQRIEEGKAGVALGRGRQIERGLGQMEAALRHPHIVERLAARHHDRQRLRVGQPHVLSGKDDHAPEDEARVLARIHHARHPVERRVGIRPAQALDERADGVVVDVALLIIEHRAALDRFLGDRQVDMDRGVGARPGRLDGQLQRVEHPARIAVRYVHQVRQRVVVDPHIKPAVAALRVGQRLSRDRAEILLGQRLELEDAAAADERLVDLEIGVLGGRADQDDRAVLDPRQQRVLLRLVEAVHLVHKEDGALAELAAALLGLCDGLADIVDAREHRVDGDEMAARGIGDDACEGRLARARRPVEDERAELIRLDRAAQQAARPHDVRLADELVQRARPHARGERSLLLGQLRSAHGEQVRRWLGHGLILT
ncbi:MAG: hypothetical protein BWY52_01914 [Chloroflexi bacterium ADurb.Bin325]|nr:MAG: hypothetical protein BWY52_01914 [Chloroflexi bacterium ADurb.Bin325]